MTASIRVLLVAVILSGSPTGGFSQTLDAADGSPSSAPPAAVIDPAQGVIYGMPFGTAEDEIAKKWGPPTGQVHLDAHRDGLLFGKSHLFLFFDRRLDGIRITNSILDWTISNWLEEKSPWTADDWQMTNGIKPGMTRQEILQIVKATPSEEKYDVTYSTGEATVQMSFSHWTNLGEGDEAYRVFGLLVVHREDGKDHWSIPPFGASFANLKGKKMLGIMIGGSPNGIRVTGVFKGSPADKAGIKADDLITRLDGASMAGGKPLDFNHLIGLKDSHEMQVTAKDGSKHTVRIQLADGATFGRAVGQLLNPTEVTLGQVAPDFEATAGHGKKIKLSELRGHPVLIIFTASWCPPCRMEAPEIKALHDKYLGRGMQFVSVYLDGATPNVFAYAKGLGVDWPIQTDGKDWDNTVARTYGIVGVPTHVLVDKNGKIVQTNVRVDELSEALENVLK